MNEAFCIGLQPVLKKAEKAVSGENILAERIFSLYLHG